MRGTPCRFYGSDLKVDTADTFRYPDGFVVCTPALRGRTSIDDPIVIFEVMRGESAGRDLVTKSYEYAAMPSVRRYILLAQDAMGGNVFERVGTDWVGHLLNADSILRMPEIDIEVPIAEFYEGVSVASAEPAAAAQGD